MTVKKYFVQLIKDRDPDIFLYLIGIAVSLFILAAVYITDVFIKYTGFGFLRQCVFRTLTGLDCPACGGTRAFICILHGDILSSLKYNPFTLYFVTVVLVFYISQSVRILTMGKVRGFHLHPAWMAAGIIILILNFIIRNLFIIF